MTISYNWLSQYLPLTVAPNDLSHILTSVGLEVEKMEGFEEVKGGLKGLVIGEVLHTEQHPNADKLKLTSVSIGNGSPLQIVCGAPNVAAGQKVVVATIGTTIYPISGDPLTMKKAKIRGIESHGMICAEDEIGLGSSHAGIMVLPADAQVGMPAEAYFRPYTDIIYEIGLTPNRMDAMSHWGVARDVCAYLSHHQRKNISPLLPETEFGTDKKALQVSVSIENREACRRYSGVCISGVQVGPSPKWMQERLKAIGLRPINNIVDITNFIQHEAGQPLHAFDYDAINGKQVIVKTLPAGTRFTTLDGKERTLHEEDLMICDAREPMCIAGVFGGLHSGVTEKTRNIFLESAWFDPIFIRKTSFRHGLRTDAAMRFEKGIDISNTVTVLKRAAMLIGEIAGGAIASGVVDLYPEPLPKKQVTLPFAYLKKLSGKNYAQEAVKRILQSLGFTIPRENQDELVLEVPYHKPDISIPADIVEEVLRIDGLDNIDIPSTISISPSVEEHYQEEQLKEKISGILTGLGFSEILTNSITNSAYFSEEELKNAVRLLNNLSSELDILRPSMLHTALEVVSFNINRKNSDLRFFEFGKTYLSQGAGVYRESNHLCLYLTGQVRENHWKGKAVPSDVFYLKGMAEAVLSALGVAPGNLEAAAAPELPNALVAIHNGSKLVQLGQADPSLVARFDIKQPVYFADINWDAIIEQTGKRIRFREIPKYPSVERDLAMVVPQSMPYAAIRNEIDKLKLDKLRNVRLFDLFESEKLGRDRKSMAISLTFLDEEKTLTDKEIDSWMNRIMTILEKELGAEIRKQ